MLSERRRPDAGRIMTYYRQSELDDLQDTPGECRRRLGGHWTGGRAVALQEDAHLLTALSDTQGKAAMDAAEQMTYLRLFWVQPEEVVADRLSALLQQVPVPSSDRLALRVTLVEFDYRGKARCCLLAVDSYRKVTDYRD